MKTRFELGDINMHDDCFEGEGDHVLKDEAIEYYKSRGWQIDEIDGIIWTIIDRSIDLNIGDILTIKGIGGQKVTYKEYNFDRDYISYGIEEI